MLASTWERGTFAYESVRTTALSTKDSLKDMKQFIYKNNKFII